MALSFCSGSGLDCVCGSTGHNETATLLGIPLCVLHTGIYTHNCYTYSTAMIIPIGCSLSHWAFSHYLWPNPPGSKWIHSPAKIFLSLHPPALLRQQCSEFLLHLWLLPVQQHESTGLLLPPVPASVSGHTDCQCLVGSDGQIHQKDSLVARSLVDSATDVHSCTAHFNVHTQLPHPTWKWRLTRLSKLTPYIFLYTVHIHASLYCRGGI